MSWHASISRFTKVTSLFGLSVVVMLAPWTWAGPKGRPAERKLTPAALAAKLGLHVIATDPAYHGDVFYTYAAPESFDPVALSLTLIELRTQGSFWTLYIERAAIDNDATRSAALAALGTALGSCPSLPGRDFLLAAIRKAPTTRLEAWEVVLGRAKSWSAPRDSSWTKPTWLTLQNGIDDTPLSGPGSVRAPQGLTLQLGCRG